jgi:hypothetical protein
MIDIVLMRVPVTAYKRDGVPTCAVDFEKGDVCKFLRLKKFGTVEVCGFNEAKLWRRGEDGLGNIIPDKHCPLWGYKDESKK